jgi:peroxiredoxin Q/BCP
MTTVTEGQTAPDFSLLLDDGRVFQLSAHRGQIVVLFFYPQDNTTGCTTENKDFSNLLSEFAKFGACVLGISPDSIEKHVKFRAKHNLTVDLAADPQRQAIEAYGVWQQKKLYGKEYMGLARTSFVIDPEGKIAAVIKAPRVAGHAEKVLAAVAGLKVGT